jgi:hypothetical protein
MNGSNGSVVDPEVKERGRRISKMFRKRIAASILGLLIFSSLSIAHDQKQPASLSEEDEAEIIEYLLQHEIKPLGSWFKGRSFSSENISPALAVRIKKHGFSLISAHDIENWKRENVIDYVILRSFSLSSGIVVVSLSDVSEGRPCFALSFSREQNFKYALRKVSNEWTVVYKKGPTPFPFSKSLGLFRY